MTGGIRRASRAVVVAIFLLTVVGGCSFVNPPPRIGVVYLFHGGFGEYSPQASWNATMQIFGYDPHSAVYRRVIWNPEAWPQLLRFGNAPKERGKYAFEYARLGGADPANALTALRYRQLAENLAAREKALGVEFVVDYASWLSPDPAHHVYPRALYYPGVADGAPLRYCGSRADGGTGPAATWPGCDPERYDTDGTIERLLRAGVDEIVFVDLTTSGVRFFKSFDVVNLARVVVAAHNAATGDAVEVYWGNDPTDLMTASYPSRPAAWKSTLGAPAADRAVPLAGRPNPIAADARLAGFHVDGIAARFAPAVDVSKTGVILVNHATRRHAQAFDPKIDDTLVLSRNIKAQLQERYPSLASAHVVGAWMGIKERVAAGHVERTRAMRGENLGEAWRYQTDEQMPGDEWGYRYWDALEYLKDSGVEHIVIAFPQIMIDSVLNLVELPNQIGKEIGFRNWARIGTPDYATYPGVGHPFADYWGIWVDTQCVDADGRGACCFEMGGCADGRPYPPPRQAAPDKPRDDLDPSLAFDVSEYGHLGYNPALGPPDPAAPVQRQYRGSWDIWAAPNGDPGVAAMLADQVVAFIRAPRPVERPLPIDFGLLREPASAAPAAVRD